MILFAAAGLISSPAGAAMDEDTIKPTTSFFVSAARASPVRQMRPAAPRHTTAACRSRPCDLWTTSQSKDKRHDEDDQKDEEKNLRDFDGAGRDSAESEERRDQRNYEEYCCSVQHGLLLSVNPTTPCG